MPSHFSRHLQGHFFCLKLSLEYVFGSSNTNLKLTGYACYHFFVWFWAWRPNGTNIIDEKGSARIRIWIWKQERLNLETATGGALQKKMFVKKLQHSQKNACDGVPFYWKETPTQVFSCEFLEILNNSFFSRTSLGDSFY